MIILILMDNILGIFMVCSYLSKFILMFLKIFTMIIINRFHYFFINNSFLEIFENLKPSNLVIFLKILI